MSTSGYRRIERRRSARVTLSVPVRIDGQTLTGEPFVIRTHTQTLSQFGCSLLLEKEIALDQVIVVMNEHTRQSAQCRVISLRRHRDEKQYVGIEFLSHGLDFWRIKFSKPGARPLKSYRDSER